MAPHLVRWHEQYGSQGLKIIEVDNGNSDSLEELQQHVTSENIPFAVLHDEGGEVCSAYGVQGYPVAYLIGESGKVLWEGIPSFDPDGAEAVVKRALAGELKPEVVNETQR